MIQPLLTACITFAVVFSLSSKTIAAPKNIIVILTDDQGYGDLSCFNSKRIKSPNIDRLASEGMKMTHFYIASSVCSPSRAVLLTATKAN